MTERVLCVCFVCMCASVQIQTTQKLIPEVRYDIAVYWCLNLFHLLKAFELLLFIIFKFELLFEF